MATDVIESGGGLHESAARRSRRGDQIFRLTSSGAGVLLLAIMAAIAVFLIVKAIPALERNKANFFLEKTWNPNEAPIRFGIAALAFGTLLSSLLALVMATPIAVAVALFISHYAPRRLAGVLGYVIDLLAAVPSVVYGLWGLAFLVPRIQGFEQWLHDNLGFIPLFGGGAVTGRSILTGSVVLAIMILPIIAAISREVFLQAPSAQAEAALALGATRWEMIRMSVLPFGRPGVISAAMLGLGRALGETITVAMVLPAAFNVSINILTATGNSIAANIANGFGESNPIGRGALIASGLVLFVITLVVNVAARLIAYRRKETARAGA